MSGKKMTDRELFTYTGYPGGQRRITPNEMLAKDETSVVRHAVKGMLPKKQIRCCYFKKLLYLLWK